MGCLNALNQLSVIRYGQAGGALTASLMKLSDLRRIGACASRRPGLPVGTSGRGHRPTARLGHRIAAAALPAAARHVAAHPDRRPAPAKHHRTSRRQPPARHPPARRPLRLRQPPCRPQPRVPPAPRPKHSATAPAARRRLAHHFATYRASAPATSAGHRLPGAGMTTQPQPPVAVTPPLPNSAQCRAAAAVFRHGDHHRGVRSSCRPTRNAASRWDLTHLRAGFLAVFAVAHLAIRRFAPVHRPAAAAGSGAAQRTGFGDDSPARSRHERAGRAEWPAVTPARRSCGRWSAWAPSRSW